jgi:hypothetical protein
MAGLNAIRVAGFWGLMAGTALCQQRVLGAASLPDSPSVQATQDMQKMSVVRVAGEYSAFVDNGRGETNSRDFFTRHLYPALGQRSARYRTGESGGLIARATSAASRTFVTREDSGKARLNTAYFLRVLSSTALHAASVPYWRRSAGAPFSDFGATIGNDAGMNVLHEFQPGLEKVLKSHTPRFVAVMEERLGQK